MEEMFRDFKSGDYNLKDTNVSVNRLISLLLIIELADKLPTLKGQKIKSKGVQKYVEIVK